MKPSLLIAAVLSAGLALSVATQAQDLYRWTDADGKLHLSDKPPPAGARSVTREPMPRSEPNPANQRAAQQRAASDQKQLEQIESARKAQNAASKPAAGTTAAEGQSQPPRNETECDRLNREFHSSASCWSGFNLASGGSRAGALEKCGPPVPDPAARCPAR
jgi:hypothetical protein